MHVNIIVLSHCSSGIDSGCCFLCSFQPPFLFCGSMVYLMFSKFLILLIIHFPLRHIDVISHNFETDYSELMQLINLSFYYKFMCYAESLWIWKYCMNCGAVCWLRSMTSDILYIDLLPKWFIKNCIYFLIETFILRGSDFIALLPHLILLLHLEKYSDSHLSQAYHTYWAARVLSGMGESVLLIHYVWSSIYFLSVSPRQSILCKRIHIMKKSLTKHIKYVQWHYHYIYPFPKVWMLVAVLGCCLFPTVTLCCSVWNSGYGSWNWHLG